ncbi:hypothetical protein ABEX44_22785 [Priestia megaterium]|mgnify:CR=1 FL=1
MKNNAWEFVEAFNEMKDVYDNLGYEDNYIDTLDHYESLLSGNVNYKSA